MRIKDRYWTGISSYTYTMGEAEKNGSPIFSGYTKERDVAEESENGRRSVCAAGKLGF